ncbi:hypothetical protein B7494_g118 [Chlorociboria aeruginascens]|nr:hypothetical protein B7494_g118 [Chlorociboria aeruginascens]
MVRVTDELALSPDEVSLYYTTDPQLSNLPVLVFHGPSTTINSTLNSSRIQVHIFTAAGFQSYPRVTISPNSPLYASVNHLPRDKQGDEVCRGIAFTLLKYFKELPEVAKGGLIIQSAFSRSNKRPGSAPTLFGEQHAADLASSLVKVENIREVIQDIKVALQPQNIGYVDIDLVLPPGSIAPFQEENEDDMDSEDDEFLDPTLKQYGSYAPLVRLFGEGAFLPTSKLRRAPSRPTSLNRTKSFLKDQKMSLRREMGELVDTEERYVIKMHELVNHMADDYRQKARNRAFGSFSPSAEDLEKLFPQCLDRIFQINSAFLVAVRKVMDDTEEDAMQDLETPSAGSTGSRYGGTGRLKDPTGALAFAKVLLEWFPQFSDCYQEYIRASQDFPQIITSFMKQQSSFSKRVQQAGEQRLRSAIIEPVQRLPRYSLFIDNIINHLPINHPALQSMLKAKDLITEICSLDPPTTDKSQVVHRLRNLVEFWPSTLHPHGRLITAVDVVEIPAPYHLVQDNILVNPTEGMLLLFADCFVILKKAKDCNMSARGFMAEIDKPSATTMMASVTAAAGGQKYTYSLSFGGWHLLNDIRFTMSDDGRNIWMTSLHELKDASIIRDRSTQTATMRAFVLQGAYEAKAARFTEEIVKARVEGRFSESERETDKWRLRSIMLSAAGVNIYTAVFEEGISSLIEGRKEPAPIRIVVDHEKGTKGAPVGHYGVEIVANVGAMDGGTKYKLEVDGLNDKVFVDEVVSEHLLPIFVKRVVDMLRLHYHIGNPSLTAAFISFYSKILKSLHINDGDKSKVSRPHSPVKLFSSFLSGGFSSSTSFTSSGSVYSSASKNQRTPMIGTIPSIQPQPLSRSNSNKSIHSIQDVDARSNTRAADDRPINPLVRLEQTFTAYVAAIQNRKGNVVGKVLRSRGATDELATNALYNAFIENPFDNRVASEVAFDILFVAFEKFLEIAWKDQMGPVISLQTLDALQAKAVKLFPGDFADYVRTIFCEMTPQNRRAFVAIVKLLADLLDGCGNDGDRGALTAAFTELLVREGEPHNYINLLDRMVEDCERLFENLGPGAANDIGNNSSLYGSMSTRRSNRSATASLTSNTSSLRRKFDTLIRQNSKAESERPSVWRTLSKTSRSVATGEPVNVSSLSKNSLNRSRSIEAPSRRPNSRDRPTVLGTFDDRPSSSNGAPSRLSTIGASPPIDEKKEKVKALKKKRRSSLSDLKILMAAANLGPTSPLPSPGHNPQISQKFNTSPRTPSPTKIPVAGGIMDRTRSEIYRTGSPTQKENTPFISSSRNVGNLTERPQNIMSTTEVVVIKDLWKGHSKTVSLSSNIPTLAGTPRTMAPSVTRPSSSPQKGTPQKLRLQSPQKLRERLQNEAKAINEAEASLQNELSQIGEEMAKLNAGSSVSSVSPERSLDIQKLSDNVKVLELKIPTLVKDMTSRNDGIKKDLEISLQASEYKVKGLDQLYKESSAENEILYEKFNGELGKIVKALKGKGKEDKEELITKLKEASEETAKTKKENSRLRREILTLRTLLKGNQSLFTTWRMTHVTPCRLRALYLLKISQVPAYTFLDFLKQITQQIYDTMSTHEDEVSPGGNNNEGISANSINSLHLQSESRDNYLKATFLPNELWKKAFTYLPLKDVKTARLVSKLWASLGAKQIYEAPFVFRLDRLDFERFDRLKDTTDRSWLSGVNTLRFESGQMDLSSMVKYLTFNYAQEKNIQLFSDGTSLLGSRDLDLEKESAILEYAGWSNKYHEAKQGHIRWDCLKNVFRELKNVEGIEVARKFCVFENELLSICYRDGRGTNDLLETKVLFEVLLTAIDTAAIKLKRLTHDEIPVTFFARSIHDLRMYSDSFQYLETLHLNLNATACPPLKFWAGLGVVLRFSPHLQNLRFGFVLLDRGRIDHGMWNQSKTPQDWYVPLWKILRSHTWKNLQVLRMDGMVFCEKGLSEFLARHASTLKDLELYHVGLWQGSYHGLLSSLKIKMSMLQHFRIWGYLRAWHAHYSREIWDIPPPSNPRVGPWDSTLDQSLTHQWGKLMASTQNYSPTSSDQVEDFVLRDSPWPLGEKDLITSGIDTQHHPIHCIECPVNASILQANWDNINMAINDPQVHDRYEWAKPDYILYIDGYDHNHYDEAGYNSAGVHLNDEVIWWNGHEGAIGGAKLERQIRREITEKLTRFQVEEIERDNVAGLRYVWRRQ